MTITLIETLVPRQYQGDNNLTEVKLGNSIQIIPRECFQSCANLKRIIIPSSVKRIDFKAFANSGLEEVIFETNSSLRILSTRCFESCQFLTSISLPSTTRIVGDFSFQGCGGLRSKLSIPENIRQLGIYAFAKCGFDDLEFCIPKVKVSHQKSKTVDIGYGSFEQCRNLQSLMIPPHIASIGPTSFSRTGVKYVEFTSELQELSPITSSTRSSTCTPSTRINLSPINDPIHHDITQHIGHHAFSYCDQLKRVVLSHFIKSIGTAAFDNSTVEEVVFSQDSQLQVIPKKMFFGCKDILDIIFPPSLISIGDYAFGVSNINTQLLASLLTNCNIQHIGKGAFSHCENLNGSIFIPSSLKSIDNAAFENASIEEIIFAPDSPITAIANEMFRSCRNLVKISLPSSMKSIGDYAFSESDIDITLFMDLFTNTNIRYIGEGAFMNCECLSDIISIPSSVKFIGRSAFANSTIEGVQFSQDSQLELIPENAFMDCCELQTVKVPLSMKFIGKYAFSSSAIDDESLEDIFSSCNIQHIDDNAFSYCNNLTQIIYIPPSVISIGDGAFASSNVKEVRFSHDSQVKVLPPNIFASCLHLDIVRFPPSIISIGDAAFKKSTIKEVIFPLDSQLESISDEVFSNCNSLSIIQLPASVKSIGNHGFYQSAINVQLFTDIFANCNIQHIGELAFGECENLIETISIPSSVKSIGNSAFADSNITEFIFLQGSQLQSIPEGMFRDCYNLKNVSFPTSLTSIAEYAFSGTGIDHVFLSNIFANFNIETIGSYAFANCTQLTKVISFPSSVVSIGDNVFAESNIEEFTFSQDSQLEILPEAIFFNCYQLKVVTLPPLMKSIGNYAFNGAGINTETISEIFTNCNIQHIGDFAFFNCEDVRGKIFIPSSVKSIGMFAFANCNIEEIIFSQDSQLESLADNVFSGCRKLRTIRLPPSVKSIGNSTFSASGIDNESFVDIFTNCEIQTIGEAAFSYCGSLVGTIFIPSSVTSIGTSAFTNSNIEEVHIAENTILVSLSEHMFSDCHRLRLIKLPPSIKFVDFYSFAELGITIELTRMIANSISSVGSTV